MSLSLVTILHSFAPASAHCREGPSDRAMVSRYGEPEGNTIVTIQTDICRTDLL